MNGRMEHDLKKEKRIATKLSTLPDYVAEWDMNLKASQKTTATRDNYVRLIGNFLQFVNSNPKEVTLEQLDIPTVQKYFISLQTKTKGNEVMETSDSYRCMAWACLNSFFSYMVKREYMKDNPIEIVEKPKNHDLARINQNRKLLTEKDFKKMLRAVEEDVDLDYEYKARNRAILLLFMTTGMRKTALTEINLEDVDLVRESIQIIDKRKKLHTYPLNDTLIDAISEWLSYRKSLERNCGGINTDALFITKYMERISGDAIMEIVNKYSRIGLGYKISPHKLRAGCASILYNKTHDLEFVRRAIGHADVGTTTRYIVTQGKEREEMSNIMGKLLD